MTCSVCKDTGLIPFKNKQGKIVPNAFEYCQCHNEPEHYHPPDPSDFDFACSSAFRGYSYERCGLPDPIQQVSPPKPKEQVVIHRHSDMGKEEYNLLQQTSLKAGYLEKRLNEHLEHKKPQPKKTGYKGLR